ncbi:MAG: LuxR family transcriptional regulator [Cyanobacteriota bacterium]|jgi:DNA-binding NarL/FixJ family response regulator
MEAEKISHEALLSARELEIVELVVTGLSNHKIAQRLEISKRTVDNHISNILKKTGATNRVELVRWSLQWGKVCLDNVNCCSIPDLEPKLQQDEVVS